MDAFDTSPLCPAATELRVDVVACTASELIITASARRHVVGCPACGHASSRVNSRYQRTLGSLARRSAHTSCRPCDRRLHPRVDR